MYIYLLYIMMNVFQVLCYIDVRDMTFVRIYCVRMSDRLDYVN